MSQNLQDAYIVKALRTPVAKFNSKFKYTRSDDLLFHVLKGVVADTLELQAAVEDVIIGCAMPEAEQSRARA